MAQLGEQKVHKFWPAPLHGDVAVPGDKSISHRALFLAAALDEQVNIAGLNSGEDVAATAHAIRQLGASVARSGTASTVVPGGLHAPQEIVDCANSGTTARLLLGVCAGANLPATLHGDASLRRRPMEPVCAQLRSFGARIETTQGRLPVTIEGRSDPQSRRFVLLSPSAQVKSALLLAGVFARTPITIYGDAHSRDHTERMLQALGAGISFDGETIALNDTNLHATQLRIPGDLSAAAFFLVAACIFEGSALRIRDVGTNPTRTGIIDALQLMGASIDITNPRTWNGEPVADLHVRSSALHGAVIEAPLTLRAIDEIVVLSVAAASARGTTTIRGIGDLRSKESDRVSAIRTLLEHAGIAAEVSDNEITIQGGNPKLADGTIATNGDHRVAMAAAVLAARAGPARIEDANVVAVSFPGFIAEFKKAQA